MTNKEINHSMSFEEKGNWYCVVCKRIKDNSEDDCECFYDNPLKVCEVEQ